MAFDWYTFWMVLLIGLLVIAFIAAFMWYRSLSRKKKEMPSHIELYFDDNFRKIMDEWDMTTRERVKTFRKDMKGRLKKIGEDIGTLEKKKGILDSRLASVENDMESLEAL